ncbi:Riboflavin synthase alpha chain, partial [Irineochytrium annulatum]
MGSISEIVPVDVTWSGGAGFSVTVANAEKVLTDANIGDSIAVNGICLTITEMESAKGTVKFGIAPETMRKTNVDDWKVGDMVNLERACKENTRLGGHVVQGHVDCPIILHSVEPDPPNSLLMTFSVPPPVPETAGAGAGTITDAMRYIIAKGYVCLNGTSLTVVSVDRVSRRFSVMLIAHTQTAVNLPRYKAGDKINLEVDEVGKYIESIVSSILLTGGEDGDGAIASLLRRTIDDRIDAKLTQYGILKK